MTTLLAAGVIILTLHKTMTKVYLGAIRSELIDLLDQAQNSILIGMAWFTNEALFTLLVNKAEEHKTVSLIISDSPANFIIRGTTQRKLDFSKLIIYRSETRIVRTVQNKFFHNKYVIIDNQLLVTGSYNWSNPAENNHENIIITDEPDVIRQFNAKHTYFSNKISTPYADYTQQFTQGVITPIFEEDADDGNFLLAQEFEALVQGHIQEATKEGLAVNLFNLQAKIKRYSAAGAARILTNAPEQSGFLQLAEMRRLDLSFESLVVNPKFKTLFDSRTIENARVKLRKYEFTC